MAHGSASKHALVRIAMMGPQSCGKTALVSMLTTGNFVETYEPTIEDNHHSSVKIRKKDQKVLIIDTAGSESSKTMKQQWASQAQGIVLVYDVTSRSSFEAIDDERKLILQARRTKKFRIILIGNKIDKTVRRVVTTAEGRLYAKKNNMKFFETSARFNTNVTSPFEEVVKYVLKHDKGGRTTKSKSARPHSLQKGKSFNGTEGRIKRAQSVSSRPHKLKKGSSFSRMSFRRLVSSKRMDE